MGHEEDKWEEAKEDERHEPATEKGKEQAREAHSQRELDCTHFFTKSFGNRLAFLGESGRELCHIDLVEPGYVLLEDSSKVGDTCFHADSF